MKQCNAAGSEEHRIFSFFFAEQRKTDSPLVEGMNQVGNHPWKGIRSRVVDPLVPLLEHPLIEDGVRLNQLYQRFLLINSFDENFISIRPQEVENIVTIQAVIEKTVESALVQKGSDPATILSNMNKIRGFMFYPQGKALSHATYLSHLKSIDSDGTLASIPYRRVLKAIEHCDLFI